ncbi:MAG: endolytic transglycosylase MltG, partial [Syntrophales bacterium LBB04]|nr:endolytic transglycosylase MltG [Syntrophales bacterium LBB04]
RIPSTTRKRRKSRVIILMVTIFFVLFTGLYYAFSPTDSRKETVTVDISKGTSFLQSVDLLEEAGLVKHKYLFYALVIIRNAHGHIRAGEYEMSASMSPMEIIDKLVKGDIKYYKILIPEDFTMREIAARLASDRLVDEKLFLSLAKDTKLLSELDIDGRSVEGYLYPETYYFDKSMGAKAIIETMVTQFRKKFTPEMDKRAEELGMTLHQVVTLASLIGKETGHEEEKPQVSAVFHNRLRKKMKLQSDPTSVYDLESFTGAVKIKHLLRKSPYNTYIIDGLPPGPIANPAIDSLQAALYPASVNYLYFVSKNDGSHDFSSSLSAHNRAIIKYQINRKKE